MQLFTDRKNFEMSKSHSLKEELAEMRASVMKDRIDIRSQLLTTQGILACVAILVICLEFLANNNGEPSQIHKALRILTLVFLLFGIYLTYNL